MSNDPFSSWSAPTQRKWKNIVRAHPLAQRFPIRLHLLGFHGPKQPQAGDQTFTHVPLRDANVPTTGSQGWRYLACTPGPLVHPQGSSGSWKNSQPGSESGGLGLMSTLCSGNTPPLWSLNDIVRPASYNLEPPPLSHLALEPLGTALA